MPLSPFVFALHSHCRIGLRSLFTTLLPLFARILALPQDEPLSDFGNSDYIDVTWGRNIPQEFIACHVMPVLKNEKPFQNPFAETPCYSMMLGEVGVPLVALLYVLGLLLSFTSMYGFSGPNGCPGRNPYHTPTRSV